MVVTRSQASDTAKPSARALPDPFTSYRSQELPSSSSESSGDEGSNNEGAAESETPSDREEGKSWGVPRWVEKKLLLSLERFGGLRIASLKAVCDSDPDSFGPKNSLRRRQVQNLVNTYKNWKESKYYGHLDSFGVQSHSELGRQAKAPRPSPSTPGRSSKALGYPPTTPRSHASLRSPSVAKTPTFRPAVPSPSPPTMSLARSAHSSSFPGQFATVIDHDPSMDDEVRGRMRGEYDL
jgi:hypothetical protein